MYNSYKAMRNRCYNPNNQAYKHYGLRGIKVCDRWLEPKGVGFKNFLEDMGERPDGHSLDRIDNNGHYCKENCRWSTNAEQSRNKRSNRILTYKDEEHIMDDLCKGFNIDPKLVRYRLKKGWTLEDAINTKPNKSRRRASLQCGIGIRDVVLSPEFAYKRSNCCRQWNKYLKSYLKGEESNEEYLTYSKFLLGRNLVTEDMILFL